MTPTPQGTDGPAAKGRDDAFKTVLQIGSILVLAAIIATILHKAYLDIDKLGQKYSGVEFWVELAKQVLKNLASGG